MSQSINQRKYQDVSSPAAVQDRHTAQNHVDSRQRSVHVSVKPKTIKEVEIRQCNTTVALRTAFLMFLAKVLHS